jgi:hypothetical protein
MVAYTRYNLPKFKEIIQIVLMLLGHPKREINLPRSNSLDHRKCITGEVMGKLMDELEAYELRRESSEAVAGEYKINKLLERCKGGARQWRRSTWKLWAGTIRG